MKYPHEKENAATQKRFDNENVPQFQLVIANRSSLLARSDVRILLLRPWDAVEGLKSAMSGEYYFSPVITASHVHIVQCSLELNVQKIFEKVKDSAC